MSQPFCALFCSAGRRLRQPFSVKWSGKRLVRRPTNHRRRIDGGERAEKHRRRALEDPMTRPQAPLTYINVR